MYRAATAEFMDCFCCWNLLLSSGLHRSLEGGRSRERERERERTWKVWRGERPEFHEVGEEDVEEVQADQKQIVLSGLRSGSGKVV
jgi:hypothetical protein